MTMLSAQPVTLTGEQHDRFWGIAKSARERAEKLSDYLDQRNDRHSDELRMVSVATLYLLNTADTIEKQLIAAVNSAAAGPASSGDAA